MKAKGFKRIALMATAAVLSIGMMVPTFDLNSASATGGVLKQ